jgi:hypothetical protein
MNKIVIYSGGFHPFTPAHKQVYDHIGEKFEDFDVWVATSNSTKNRPFNFEQKRTIMIESGVFEDEIVQVEQPYSPKEILDNYDPNMDICVFVVSKKDSDRFEGDDGGKYLEFPENSEDLKPFGKNYYVYYCPEYSFKIDETEIRDASFVREMYKKANSEVRENILQLMYPNSKDIPLLQRIFDEALGKKSFSDILNEVKAGYDDWGFVTQNGTIIDGTKDRTARFHRELLQKIVLDKKLASKYFTSEQHEDIMKNEVEGVGTNWLHVPMSVAFDYGWCRWYFKDSREVTFDMVMGEITRAKGIQRELTYRQRRAILGIINKYPNKERLMYSLYTSTLMSGRFEGLKYSEFLSILL